LFIDKLKTQTNIKVNDSYKYGKEVEPSYGSFIRKQVIITMEDECKFIIDCIASKSFPVNDFYVNDLILINGKVSHISQDVVQLNLCLSLIKSKHMTPKDEFIQKIKSDINGYHDPRLLGPYTRVSGTLGGTYYRLAKFKSLGWNLGQLHENIIFTNVQPFYSVHNPSFGNN